MGKTALRTMLGAVALVGLFAMHGLATHGSAHPGRTGEASVAFMTVGSNHSSHPMVADAPLGPASIAGDASDTNTDGDWLGFGGICLAVLLLGIVGAARFARAAAFVHTRAEPLLVTGVP